MSSQQRRQLLRRQLSERGLNQPSEERRTVFSWLISDLRREDPPDWQSQLPAAVDLALEIYRSFNAAFTAFYDAPDSRGAGHVRRALRRQFGFAAEPNVEAVLDRIRNRRLRLLNHCRRRYQPSLFAPRTFDASRLAGYLTAVARLESLHLPQEKATGAFEDFAQFYRARGEFPSLTEEEWRDGEGPLPPGPPRGTGGEPPSEDRPSPPEYIRRHTDVSFPASPRVGERYNLRLQLVPTEEELPSGKVRPVPRPHEHDQTLTVKVATRVTVIVSADNFDVEGAREGELAVPLRGKSAALHFWLRGRQPGRGRIMVDFLQEGRPLGSVELEPEITAADQTAENRPAVGRGEVSLATRAAPGPDLTLVVLKSRYGDAPGRRLQFLLWSNRQVFGDLPGMFGDLGEQDLDSDLALWVEGQLRRLSDKARRSRLESEETVRAALETLSEVGQALFEKLLPPRLQELCWHLEQRPACSVLILSDAPHIPWELIKPHRKDQRTGQYETGQFWGEKLILAHWPREGHPAHGFSLNRVIALAAGANVPGGGAEADAPAAAVPQANDPGAVRFADQELGVLLDLKKRGADVTPLPARLGALKDALKEGKFSLLHLGCHNRFEGPFAADESYVALEDGPFFVGELTRPLEGVLRSAAPLIFFNACASGRTGFSLTGLGSWGVRFAQLGCGAFIGSLWEVTSRGAVVFARAFYEHLAACRPLGEVMLLAKQEVRRHYPQDPTWLAYCCFGDPMARVERADPVHPQP
jgi:hypothetical protein